MLLFDIMLIVQSSCYEQLFKSPEVLMSPSGVKVYERIKQRNFSNSNSYDIASRSFEVFCAPCKQHGTCIFVSNFEL